jgi:nucleoside 2-deoxyribosyltransferase
MSRSIYVMGSMRNPRVPEIANLLREAGWDAFDDWISPGPNADDCWQEYEKQRGRTFREALDGYHAQHVFALDKYHLDRCDVGVLVLPAGKSAHMELGYLRGCKKPTYVLLDGEPERFDIMYLFATECFTSVDELLFWARGHAL